MTVCKRVLFRGRVQGVGFRQTTHALAKMFPVKGYVRNLPDGRVEMVLEGDIIDVDAFIGRIGGMMGDNVEDQEEEEIPTQNFATFEIRR